MSIKVLVISNYTDYHSTRPEAAIFKGLAKMGVEVHVMTYAHTAMAKELQESGIRLVDFHPERKFNRTEIRRIRSYITTHRIQILHLFNSPAIINGIRAAKGLPVKVVLYRGASSNIHWYDPTAYLKYLHPRVDKIMCNSLGVEEMIQRQILWRRGRTITINKGHQTSWYEGYEPYAIKEELGLPKDAFLLVNVANNRKMKGIPILLNAMSFLPVDAPIHLLLIGRDMDDAANMRIIEQSPNKDKIHLLGFRKNVLPIVAACDVFVLPSISTESITKSVIEAMSLEVAPIISDISGNKELVVDGKSGLIFPSKDEKALAVAIKRIFNDPKWHKQLAVNAKKHIQTNLNSKTTVLKVKKLYESLVSHG